MHINPIIGLVDLRQCNSPKAKLSCVEDPSNDPRRESGYLREIPRGERDRIHGEFECISVGARGLRGGIFGRWPQRGVPLALPVLCRAPSLQSKPSSEAQRLSSSSFCPAFAWTIQQHVTGGARFHERVVLLDYFEYGVAAWARQKSLPRRTNHVVSSDRSA